MDPFQIYGVIGLTIDYENNSWGLTDFFLVLDPGTATEMHKATCHIGGFVTAAPSLKFGPWSRS
jgi:hypothetical protein